LRLSSKGRNRLSGGCALNLFGCRNRGKPLTSSQGSGAFRHAAKLRPSFGL
jgi:hypothetical protein